MLSVPLEPRRSMGILSVLVKDTKSVEEEKKRGCGNQPTGSMVNPRPPPLLFFGLGIRWMCS